MQPETPETLYTEDQNTQNEQFSEVSTNTPSVDTAVSWQASEYVQHEKDTVWFAALVGIVLVFLAIDFFFIKSWTFGLLIIVMAVALVVWARRPPRVISYVLGSNTLQVDEKQFSLQDFRAFGVLQEEATHSVQLLPVKRFMPAVTIYFSADDGEQIVDLLGASLPMQPLQPDVVDMISRKIRF